MGRRSRKNLSYRSTMVEMLLWVSLLAALSPPLPRRQRIWISPQTTMGRLRFVLGRVQRPVGRVMIEHPCHAAPHLLDAGVDADATHAADNAAVAVAALALNDGIPAKAKVGKGLLRLLAERLPLLRCVDLGQPYAVLLPSGIEHVHRVAVYYANDPATQLAGLSGGDQEKDGGQCCPDHHLHALGGCAPSPGASRASSGSIASILPRKPAASSRAVASARRAASASACALSTRISEDRTAAIEPVHSHAFDVSG